MCGAPRPPAPMEGFYQPQVSCLEVSHGFRSASSVTQPRTQHTGTAAAFSYSAVRHSTVSSRVT